MQRLLAGLALGAMVAGASVAWGRGDGLSEMVEAERAFARMSVSVGQREAFVTFFAEEGVVFGPGPVNGREFYRQRPPTPKPQARLLDWEPAVADVALSNDLAFSTGPFAVQDAVHGRRLFTGWFFSIWKRQPDGEWRVMVDLGVRVEHELALRPRSVERATPAGVAPAAGAGNSHLDAVRGLDAALADSLTRGNLPAYLALVTPNTRVYRDGHQPAVGPDAIRALVEKEPRPAFRAVHAAISAAGDFAYVYGTVEATPAEGKPPQQGGFVRVWRRLKDGWVLAAEGVS